VAINRPVNYSKFMTLTKEEFTLKLLDFVHRSTKIISSPPAPISVHILPSINFFLSFVAVFPNSSIML
jgi:hypothetical protein